MQSAEKTHMNKAAGLDWTQRRSRRVLGSEARENLGRVRSCWHCPFYLLTVRRQQKWRSWETGSPETVLLFCRAGLQRLQDKHKEMKQSLLLALSPHIDYEVDIVELLNIIALGWTQPLAFSSPCLSNFMLNAAIFFSILAPAYWFLSHSGHDCSVNGCYSS